MIILKKDLNYYMSLDYSLITYKEQYGGEEYIVAEIPELKGCSANGKIIDEALKELSEAKKAWIASALDNDEEIPLPEKFEEYSGKLILRIPPRTHKKVKELASEEGVSLNTWFNKAVEIKIAQEENQIDLRQEFRLLRSEFKQDLAIQLRQIQGIVSGIMQERKEPIPLTLSTSWPNWLHEDPNIVVTSVGSGQFVAMQANDYGYKQFQLASRGLYQVKSQKLEEAG